MSYCEPERGRAALLTLSAQEDYLRADSPLRVCSADGAARAIRRLAEGFRAHEAPIFHAVRLYRPDGSNVDACRRSAIEEGLRVLMPGSLGAELVADLKPQPGVRLDPERLLNGGFQILGPREWVFYRARWGAFHDTGLEDRLRELDITTLVMAGLGSATGTRATVYEASARDLRTVVVPDALGTHTWVEELGRIGTYLMTTENCLAWLDGPNRPCAAA